MYTRCPSCRAEISFEPPANMESLPDGYKHRIKCPSCGVTIGVKINKIDTAPATLVQQAPAYTQPQTNFEPVYTNANEEAVPQKKVKAKHSGVGRNVTMMIMSLLFIALSVVGYLVNTNVIKIEGGLYGIGNLDGITCWNTLIQDFAVFKAYFDDPVTGILTILPMIVFTLAGINFIVALVSACGKKYGRAYNLIMSIVLAALRGGYSLPSVHCGEGRMGRQYSRLLQRLSRQRILYAYRIRGTRRVATHLRSLLLQVLEEKRKES